MPVRAIILFAVSLAIFSGCYTTARPPRELPSKIYNEFVNLFEKSDAKLVANCFHPDVLKDVGAQTRELFSKYDFDVHVIGITKDDLKKNDEELGSLRIENAISRLNGGYGFRYSCMILDHLQKRLAYENEAVKEDVGTNMTVIPRILPDPERAEQIVVVDVDRAIALKMRRSEKGWKIDLNPLEKLDEKEFPHMRKVK